jgi:hypothetical protein
MGHRAPSIADNARTVRAEPNAADPAPATAELQAAGISSLNGIAAAPNERGVPTPAGRRHHMRGRLRGCRGGWRGDALSWRFEFGQHFVAQDFRVAFAGLRKLDNLRDDDFRQRVFTVA